jgi:hypothetical protein
LGGCDRGNWPRDPTLRRYVEDKLGLRWSAQQISRRLITEFPHDGIPADVARDDLHLARTPSLA